MKYLHLLLTRSFKDDTSDQLEIATFSTCTGMAVGPLKASPRAGDFHSPSELGVSMTSNAQSTSWGHTRWVITHQPPELTGTP